MVYDRELAMDSRKELLTLTWLKMTILVMIMA